MHVLIVDDNENCLQLLQQVIQFLPEVHVMEASDGAEAWWHLTDPTRAFDLMIADLHMPHVDGVALTKRIRATPALRHLRIILCTAVHDRKTVECFKNLGITHYVVKPFAIPTMLEKIQHALAVSG